MPFLAITDNNNNNNNNIDQQRILVMSGVVKDVVLPR